MRELLQATVAAALASFVMLTPDDSRAAIVTWDYTARVTSQIGTSYSIGDVIPGWVSFDNSIPDANVSPFAGQYPGSVQAWQHASFQSTTYSPVTYNTGFVYDDLPWSGPFLDRMYLVTAWAGGSFLLEVNHSSNAPSNLLAGESLPTSPPDLSLATIAVANVAFAGAGPYLYTELLTLTLRQDTPTGDVPAPAGLALLGVGLMGLASAARRRRIECHNAWHPCSPAAATFF